MMDHFLTVIIFIYTFTLRDPIGKFPCFEGLLFLVTLVMICTISCALSWNKIFIGVKNTIVYKIREGGVQISDPPSRSN